MKNLVQFLNESLITESFGSKIISNLFSGLRQGKENVKPMMNKYQWDKITDDDITEVTYSYFKDNNNIKDIINKMRKNQAILICTNSKDNGNVGILTADSGFGIYRGSGFNYNNINNLNPEELSKNIENECRNIFGGVYKNAPIYIVDVTGLDTDDIRDKRAELKKGIQTAMSMTKDLNRKLRALKDAKRASRTNSNKSEITPEQVKDLVVRYSNAILAFKDIQNKIGDNADLMTDVIHLMFELKEYNENVETMDKSEAYNQMSELCDKMEKIANDYK